jgi:hypothetical protein
MRTRTLNKRATIRMLIEEIGHVMKSLVERSVSTNWNQSYELPKTSMTTVVRGNCSIYPDSKSHWSRLPVGRSWGVPDRLGNSHAQFMDLIWLPENGEWNIGGRGSTRIASG